MVLVTDVMGMYICKVIQLPNDMFVYFVYNVVNIYYFSMMV